MGWERPTKKRTAKATAVPDWARAQQQPVWDSAEVILGSPEWVWESAIGTPMRTGACQQPATIVLDDANARHLWDAAQYVCQSGVA